MDAPAGIGMSTAAEHAEKIASIFMGRDDNSIYSSLNLNEVGRKMADAIKKRSICGGLSFTCDES